MSRARHDDPERELLHSPQEYLHAFLRSLDAKAERLPERFVTLLRARARALRRGEPGPHAALEDACYRLFVSQERADLARAAVMAILEKRLERADELVRKTVGEFRGVLDRLELATERRDPVIADLARQLRNRYYDQPVIAERQAQAYAELERHLKRAAGGPGPRRPRGAHPRRRRGAAAAGAAAHRAHERHQRARAPGAAGDHDPPLVPARTSSTPFWTGVTRDGTAYITTSYEKNGTRRHLAAAFVDTQDLDDVAGAISRRAARVPAGRDGLPGPLRRRDAPARSSRTA